MDTTSKIYIAGHRGLVGSAIMRHLQKAGFTNIVVRTHKELDLTNTVAVAAFFEEEKPKYVILAAAKVGGIYANNTYRADFIYENLMIQNNVIHQSHLAGVEKLLFLGSTCIYPKNCSQPIKESYLLTDTLEYTNEPYAIAKIAGIKMCESYNVQYNTNFISAMPTNLYGPNDNFDLLNAHVLPALLRKIHLGKLWEQKDWKNIRADLKSLPINAIDASASEDEIVACFNDNGISEVSGKVTVEIWGSGAPMREFLWVEDMAEACVFLLENMNFKASHDNEKNRNTHINIGTGSDVSIADLAKQIKHIIGFNGDFVFNKDKPDGTMRKVTDVSKINGLGWKASVPLAEGVATMYDWYLKNR